MRSMLKTILFYETIPSKLDEWLNNSDGSKNSRWREVSNYKPIAYFTPSELTQMGDDVQIVPQAHHDKAFDRYLPVTKELMWFLGWYLAEGSLSKHQISLSLGKKDEAFLPELTQAVEQVFGETPRCHYDRDSEAIKFYFHSVAGARLMKAWGLGKKADQKSVPDIVFSLSADLQYSFLEGYFLGDGTTIGTNISFVTNSHLLKEGLLYLLGQLGLIATHTEHQAKSNDLITTKHNYYSVTVCGKQQLEECEAIWQRHRNSQKVRDYLAKPTRQQLDFVAISDDLMGLKVISHEEIDLVGDYVYDFSVENDENFIAGTGGYCLA